MKETEPVTTESRLAAVESFIEQQKAIRTKAVALALAEDARRKAEQAAERAALDAISARAAEHQARTALFSHFLTL